MKTLDLSSLLVADFSECTIKNRNWFFFEIEGFKYHLYFEEDLQHNHYTIQSIVHTQRDCHFCTEKIFQRELCEVLFSQRIELFHLLLKRSKKRLKWLTCVIQ